MEKRVPEKLPTYDWENYMNAYRFDLNGVQVEIGHTYMRELGKTCEVYLTVVKNTEYIVPGYTNVYMPFNSDLNVFTQKNIKRIRNELVQYCRYLLRQTWCKEVYLEPCDDRRYTATVYLLRKDFKLSLSKWSRVIVVKMEG